jgi:hypothetical protein
MVCQLLSEVFERFCGGVKTDEQMRKLAEILRRHGGGEGQAADPPFVHRIDDARDDHHLLGIDLEMALSQKEKVIL